MTNKKLRILAPIGVLALVAVASPVGAKPAAASMTPAQHKAAVSQRLQAVRAKVAAMKADHKAKLADKRLEVCNKRADKINQIVSNSVEQSRKNLDVFAGIEQRVEDFYTSKQLSVANYDALTTAADQKKADAEAALQVAAETSFSCDQTNPAHPGEIIKTLMQTQHQALKDYRTSVKNLIVAVKHGLASSSDTQKSDTNDSTDSSEANKATSESTDTQTKLNDQENQ
jgi:hypothetical protein